MRIRLEPLRHIIITALATALTAARLHAADVTWDAPQTITDATDVSTSGILVGAYNVGAVGVPSTTVNGVTFQSFPTVSGNGTSGDFTTVGTGFIGDSNTGGSSANAPFSSLPAAYQVLLESYTTPFGGNITLTISGLMVGDQYQFQFWSNNSDGQFGYQITATAGNTVTLTSNTSFDDGGVGQFVTGTFTADAATQTINFAGDGDGGFLNGFQVRDVTPSTATSVPDSGTTCTMLLAAICVLALAHRRLADARR